MSTVLSATGGVTREGGGAAGAASVSCRRLQKLNVDRRSRRDTTRTMVEAIALRSQGWGLHVSHRKRNWVCTWDRTRDKKQTAKRFMMAIWDTTGNAFPAFTALHEWPTANTWIVATGGYHCEPKLGMFQEGRWQNAILWQLRWSDATDEVQYLKGYLMS